MGVGTKSIRVRKIDPGMTERMFKQLNSIPSAVKVISKESLHAMAVEGANYAKQHHPYEDRTTNLTRSIHGTPATEEGVKIIAYIVAAMQYAPWVELGTSRSRPYPFLEPAGSRPYPFLEPAAIAVVRGASGHRILKNLMSAQRLAQGLNSKAPMKKR